MLDSALLLVAPPIPLAIDPATTATGNALAQQLATSEWLGPLAPIALSPFFGLTALSGIATYGPEWLQQRSGLFAESSMLNSPMLFWTMLMLSILTSLPRLSKVSKPLALAAENLEAYSAIIILIAVRMLAGAGPAADSSQEVASNTFSNVVLSAGVVSVSIDVLMSAVAALNVLVINGVKLFCEFVIWLVPFPTIDALVELVNKALCAALLSLYCFSPTAATAVNLLVLIACALIFGWTYRRLRYYRHVIAGPLLAWLSPSWFAQRGQTFIGFCEEPTAGFPRYSLVTIDRNSTTGFRVTGRWWWKRLELSLDAKTEETETGVIANRLVLVDASGKEFAFLHRHWVAGDSLYNRGTPSVAAS